MKTTTLPVRHIAGPYGTNFQQFCKHCNTLLADDSFAHARGEVTRGWEEDSVVTIHEPAPGQKKIIAGFTPNSVSCLTQLMVES